MPSNLLCAIGLPACRLVGQPILAAAAFQAASSPSDPSATASHFSETLNSRTDSEELLPGRLTGVPSGSGRLGAVCLLALRKRTGDKIAGVTWTGQSPDTRSSFRRKRRSSFACVNASSSQRP
jgi:hypothetical protein